MKDVSYLAAKTRKKLFLYYFLLLTHSLPTPYNTAYPQHTIPTDLTSLHASKAFITKLFFDPSMSALPISM